MHPRFLVSPRPPTWAIVAVVTLAHGALAWGLVHWSDVPDQLAPPRLSVQWLTEPTAEATQAKPDTRAKASPTALATNLATAKTPPAAQSPTALSPIAPANPSAFAYTLTLTSANPAAPASNPSAPGQSGLATDPAPTPGPAATPDATNRSGVAPGASTSAAATSPRHDVAYLHNPKPDYPTRSRQLGETGTVVLKVRVEANGRASQVLLSKSSGHERLDAAALESVKQWRFVPAQEGNQAVGAWVLVPVPFGLE